MSESKKVLQLGRLPQKELKELKLNYHEKIFNSTYFNCFICLLYRKANEAQTKINVKFKISTF